MRDLLELNMCVSSIFACDNLSKKINGQNERDRERETKKKKYHVWT